MSYDPFPTAASQGTRRHQTRETEGGRMEGLRTSQLSRRTLAAVLVFALCDGSRADAQGAATTRSAPLQATVAPGAVGKPAPTPAPIGGLRTSGSVSANRATRTAGATVPRVRSPRVFGGTVLLSVPDAPYSHGAVVVTSSDASSLYFDRRAMWSPTAAPPRWRRDTTEMVVDAWRDLIVSDVVCNGVGDCRDREQRVRARWIARCGCYAFADVFNRVWRVE